MGAFGGNDRGKGRCPSPAAEAGWWLEEPETKGVARHYEFDRRAGGVVRGWEGWWAGLGPVQGAG